MKPKTKKSQAQLNKEAYNQVAAYTKAIAQHQYLESLSKDQKVQKILAWCKQQNQMFKDHGILPGKFEDVVESPKPISRAALTRQGWKELRSILK